MSLTVSPEVAEHIRPGEQTVVMIVEAGPGCDGGYQCPAERHSLGCYAGSANDPDDWERNKPQPPADLVALRDARCETCGGEGVLQRNTGDFIAGAPVFNLIDCTNPDCHDGRKLVEVRWRCIPMCTNGEIGKWADGHACAYCDGSGDRTLHGLIDVVPVVDGGFDHDWKAPQLVVDRAGVALFGPLLTNGFELDPTHIAALTAQLGRPIEPGMFAVTFEAVER